MAGSIEGHCRVLSLADYQVSPSREAPNVWLALIKGWCGPAGCILLQTLVCAVGILLREAHDRGAGLQICITSACAGECISDLRIVHLHGLLLQKLETVINSAFFQRFSYDVRCALSSFWQCRIQCLLYIACLFRLLSLWCPLP